MKKLTNLIFKNREKRKKTLLVVLILVCILFLPTSFAHAGLFENAIKTVLIGVLTFVGWLLSLAATLFSFIIDPANISAEKTGILNKKAIKDVWIMTRDVLNMTFIMVLLFSAFCTIFQIEKWNIRKVWLNILIFALLVNFSYAIARFIIDISNVAMYYFLDNMFSYSGNMNGGGIFSQFGSESRIGRIMLPNGYAEQEISYLLAMIIFTFIMGMTLFIIAVLFVVRLIALAILIMFAPIGFVGYIFPETSGYASKWWKQLFSYSFFAPIMVFMMGVALQIAKAIGGENFESFKIHASNNSSATMSSWIAEAAFFSIPIVILWMGMGIAKGMSIAGAGVITDKAQGIAKGVGAWIAKAPWRAAKFGANATGIPGGIKQRYNKFTGGLQAGQKQREAAWAKRFGVAGAEETDLRNRSEQYKKDNISFTDLKAKAARGDMAAALRLAEEGKIDELDYGNIQKHLAGQKNEKLRNMINGKVEKKNIDAVIKHRIGGINSSLSATQKLAEEDRITTEEFGKLNADGWKSQENLGKMFDPATPGNMPYIRNGHKAFNAMAGSARADVAKSVSGTTAKNLKNAGFKNM